MTELLDSDTLMLGILALTFVLVAALARRQGNERRDVVLMTVMAVLVTAGAGWSATI